MAGADGIHAAGHTAMTARTPDRRLTSASAARATAARTRLRELALAALAPVACTALLVALLSAWVATGGAGTITRVRIQVSLAAVPMRAFSPGAASAVGAATTYLVIRNLSGGADALVSARSPAAPHIVLTTHRGEGAAEPRTVVADLVIPAHATITLNPFGDDVVLMDPPLLRAGQFILLALTFRHGGTITVQAAVTPPGTP